MEFSPIVSKAGWVAACAAATVISCPGSAQEARRFQFELPAQSLDASLRDVSAITRQNVLADGRLTKGKTAPAVSGTYSVRDILNLLLAGSGLRIEDFKGTYIVRAEARSTTNAPASRQTTATPDIVVTGTHIRGARAASPLIVSTRQSLEDAGVTDMTGFSRVIPQNFTGGQNPGVAGGGDQGGQSNINNSTTLNLRGLGADATLTLINGHRLAYDALLQGVDISSVPLDAIDRIEIVPDGASAIYGSDAVGGVANITLRRDYSGLKTTALIGAATAGGDVRQQYDVLTGARWLDGGFMVAANYARNTPIYADERDYTRQLNATQMLISSQKQIAAVVAGHQQLTDSIEFDLDAQFADRRMKKAIAYTTDADLTENGQINSPSLWSFAVTPSLHVDLPSHWTSVIQGTKSVSKTTIRSHIFSSGTETGARGIYRNRLTNVEASAEGPLVRLPGGTARLALGGGYRSFGLDINVQYDRGGVTSISRNGAENRDSIFAYGELSVPLVGSDIKIPFIEALQFSAALRYERYNRIGEVTTPKFGLIYSPVRALTIKASWGRSFKIPTLDQTNRIQAGGLLPARLFSPQPTTPLAPGAAVLLLSGGNPDLRPERAQTWTTTLEFSPAFVDGLTLKASYFDINYRDRISAPITDILSALGNSAYTTFITLHPTVKRVDDIVASLPQPATNATGRPFEPSDVGAIIDARLRNTARERARGVDLAADYRVTLGEHQRLQVSASATYLDAKQQLIAGEAYVARSGVVFNPPNWRARFSGDWQNRHLQVSAVLNYVGGVDDNRLAFLDDVAPFTTLDLSARLRTDATNGLMRNVEFRLSASNILDNRPAIIGSSDPSAIPYDSTNQSAVGRFISVAVTKKW